MYTRRCLVLLYCLLSCGLAACAGGSGSSGFDNHPPQNAAENAAIQQALSEQRCVQHESLTICPAAVPGTPSPTATVSGLTPTPTSAPSAPTATPNGNVPSPGIVPTATPTAAATTTPVTSRPPATPTATATMTVPPGMEQVSLAINPGTPVFCAPAAPDGGCAFVVRFATSGFPATAVFRVAVRTLNPTGPWAIGTALISGGAPTSSFDAPVAVSGGPSTPAAGPVAAQAAVLVFASGADSVPAAVSELTDSGAEAAFVTPPFTLQPD